MKNQCDSFAIDDTRFTFIAKCAAKTSLLLVGFVSINMVKFGYLVDETASVFDFILFSFLFVPSFIMTMASNRFYVATAYILYLITKNNNDIKAVDEGYRGICEMRKVSLFSRHLSKMAAARINFLAIIHADLHQLFVDFNLMYAKYIVLILGFCFVNIVFEVSTCVTFLSLEMADSRRLSVCLSVCLVVFRWKLI
jgi:hypothetical protein